MVQYRVFQLKLHPIKDAERIAWLERQSDCTDSIRALVDDAVRGGPQAQSTCASIDLWPIRPIIEAVVDKKLFGVLAYSNAEQENKESPELGARLDALS